MTEVIQYVNLTWPEVARLDRDIPIVLPFGEIFSPGDLMAELGSPNKFIFLPSIPYGWEGSGLVVAMSSLSAIVANLLACLQEDGFTHLYVYTPVELSLPGKCKVLRSSSASSTVGPTPRNPSQVVMIPIGHTEQHGYHLPLSTDTLCIEAISRGVEQSSPDRAFTLPVFPYGVSTHRREFPGTLNCGGRAFEDFFLDVIESLSAKGFRMTYLISGHGGNCSFLSNVVKVAGERYPNGFCATTWLYLSGPKGIKALNRYRQSTTGGMGHACELETSLILALKPELVHMDRVVDETEFISTPSYYQDWVEGGALVANPPWSDDTETGAYGAGSLGTAEKGRLWLKAAIDEKVDQVNEIIEQHTKRVEKRARMKG